MAGRSSLTVIFLEFYPVLPEHVTDKFFVESSVIDDSDHLLFSDTNYMSVGLLWGKKSNQSVFYSSL